LDQLASKMKAIPIGAEDFPIIVIIEQEETGPEKEMTEEFMKDLIRKTHCCSNKLSLIEAMKEK
jgi:hypothetical protein